MQKFAHLDFLRKYSSFKMMVENGTISICSSEKNPSVDVILSKSLNILPFFKRELAYFLPPCKRK